MSVARGVGPFSAPGRWHKGSVHTHTTASDGVVPPEVLCERYREAGFDFVSLTDHGKVTVPRRLPGGLLWVPGVELNAGAFHVVALDCREAPDLAGLSRQGILDRLDRLGATAIVCHPYWSAITSRELLALERWRLMEIHNASAEFAEARGSSSIHWDEVLQEGRLVFGLAVDDCHRGTAPGPWSDVAAAWVMVKSAALSAEAVCEALRTGMFYSSTGVVIEDLSFDGRTARVRSSPVEYADFMSYNGFSRRVSAGGKEFTEAEFTLRGVEPYLRVALGRRDGARAWTNPLFVKRRR